MISILHYHTDGPSQLMISISHHYASGYLTVLGALHAVHRVSSSSYFLSGCLNAFQTMMISILRYHTDGPSQLMISISHHYASGYLTVLGALHAVHRVSSSSYFPSGCLNAFQTTMISILVITLTVLPMHLIALATERSFSNSRSNSPRNRQIFLEFQILLPMRRMGLISTAGDACAPPSHHSKWEEYPSANDCPLLLLLRSLHHPCWRPHKSLFLWIESRSSSIDIKLQQCRWKTCSVCLLSYHPTLYSLLQKSRRRHGHHLCIAITFPPKFRMMGERSNTFSPAKCMFTVWAMSFQLIFFIETLPKMSHGSDMMTVQAISSAMPLIVIRNQSTSRTPSSPLLTGPPMILASFG
jgi:hypothetical protein